MSYIEDVAQGRWYRPDLVKGYSEEEIKQIEDLYHIRIQGELKQFMRCMGRSAGGLLADNTMMLYYLQPRSYMIHHQSNTDDLIHYSGYDFSTVNAFCFAQISETNIYFLKTTSENPERVYHYVEGGKGIRDTGKNFTEFLKSVVRDYGDLTPQSLQYRYTGELLPQSTHHGEEFVADYANKQQAYINELIQLKPNGDYDISQVKGLTLSEISALEHVYKIQIKGQLKDFMHYMGRSSGGILSDNFIFYNNMSLVEKVNYIEGTVENFSRRDSDNYSGRENYFIFMVYSQIHHFFLVTSRDDADMVHHYDSYNIVLANTGKTLLEFIKEIVRNS